MAEAKWITGLINNSAILLALGILFDLLLSKEFIRNKYLRQIFIGLLAGGMAVIVMISPVKFANGIFFDTRSIIMGISGLFFGVIPTTIGAVIASLYRFLEGGGGAWVGVIVIFSSGITGVLWNKFRRRHKKDTNIAEIFLFGVVIHVEMMLLMLALPEADRMDVFLQMIIPVLSVFPVATALFGRLMSVRLRRNFILERLRQSEHRLRDIFENAPVGIFRTTTSGKTLEVNREMARILGCNTPREAVNHFTELSSQLYARPERRREFIKELKEKGRVADFQYEGKKIDGDKIWISMNARLYRDEYNNVSVIDGFSWDVTDKKKVQQELTAALEEREILLRELYHRTKNNMQVIVSMLSLKRSVVESGEVKSALKEMEGKIFAMALVHQKLYKSKNLSRLDLKEYLLELGQLIEEAYRRSLSKIEVAYDLCSLSVLIDTAVPIGLIVNEFMVNAFKHAFPEGMSGKVQVNLSSLNDSEYAVTVSDNGVGIKDKDFDTKLGRTLGLRTIKNLARGQLGGKAFFSSDGGFTGKIVFVPDLYH